MSETVEGPVKLSAQVDGDVSVDSTTTAKSYAEAAGKPLVNGASNAIADPPVPNGKAVSDAMKATQSFGENRRKRTAEKADMEQRDKKDAKDRAVGIKHRVAALYNEAQLERGYQEVNGSGLVSPKAPPGYHTALELDEMEKPVRKRPSSDRTAREELVSGRKAGQGWNSSAMRFAPLNIPLQRRLQTLAVTFHAISLPIIFGTFLLLCAIPILWPLLVPYIIYTMLSDAHCSGKLARRSDIMRRLPIWSLFASYFPARLHRSAELPDTRKYIFGYHPHGIISHGAFAAFGTEALGFSHLFPGITNSLLTLETNFRTPLYRDYALSLGLASVSKESCENILNRGGINGEGMGRAITIVVGGARESLDAQPHTMQLVLRRRKGFVKLAIQNGADLVPVIGFGENEIYEQFQPDAHPVIHRVQLLLKRALGFTIPLFHARGMFNYDVGLLPYRRPMNIVVGRPILVEQATTPDPKYVDKMHQQYIDELLRLWNTWKDTFAKDRIAELEIVE